MRQSRELLWHKTNLNKRYRKTSVAQIEQVVILIDVFWNLTIGVEFKNILYHFKCFKIFLPY